MYLEIVTPDKKIFEGEVVAVSFPGTDGFFQVLNNHAPLVSTLSKGLIVYRDKNDYESEITVDGGVVEVLHNKVIVLAESIVDEED